MPAPEIRKSGPQLTAAEIKTFEELVSGKLPASYRDFLLRHNGGQPMPEVFCQDGEPYSNVSAFFGLGIKPRFRDLRHQYRATRKDMPDAILPIALELGGNLICLAYKGENRGKVYFWNHEGAPEPVNFTEMFPGIIFNEDPAVPDQTPIDWPGHPDLTLLADSFEEFLDSFTADE